ncbi:polymorphic toxin-type HINT domain-containing protein [Leeia aquatica]|uniref:Hint domain-containing protein n=1 Tax=Leeia aquatica TaxID=2725557 RepID=A0A847SA35_9NEIS|nr:polymorphic toxin-type HINT domain-containing protein [Leeia aquatica]NLR75797.1 hypothetical protein [Leeia aquatica]
MKNTMHKMPIIRTLPLLLATLWSAADAASLTRTVSYSYDAQGALKQEVVEPDNPALRLQTDYTLDGWGNVTNTTVSGQGVTSRTRKTTYDTQGRLPVSTENAKGQQTSLVLDPVWGQIKTSTDGNQLSVSYEYDGLGRKIKSTSVDGIVTSWTYAFCSELAGCSYKLSRHTNGQPDVTDYIDGLGRTLRSSVVGFDGRTSLVDTEYDELGRVKRKSDPYYPGDTPRWTVYEYDALSRVTKETRPDAGYNQYSYNGLDTTLTNAKLQTNVKTVNSQGQLVKVVDAAGKSLRYDYDPFGNLVQTIDSQGNRIALEYDLRGRKTRMSDPDLGAWNYSYNVYGELTGQTDARGNSTTLSYDSLGRLIARTEADFNSAWEYDTASKGIGKLAKATATNGYVREYQYDAYGREQEVRYTIDQPTPYVKQTRYDSLGRVSGYSYPTGVQVDYLYNAQGYAYQLKNSQSGRVYWTANTLSASGKVLQDTLGNGVTTQRQYDELDRLKQTEASLSGDLRFREVYSWDKVGNLLERNSQYANGNLATDRFTYDALNRLTLSSGDAPVSTQEVQYDELGNILYKTAVGSYSYPAPGTARPHAVSSINNGSSIRSFNYDANGNLLNDGQRTLSWTSFNLPATIQGYGQSETYSYDAEHERVKQVSSVWGTQIYINPAAGAGLFYEKTSKDGKTEHHHYLTANGDVVGDYLTRDNPGVGELPAEERYWLKDHLGSNRAVLNASGGLLESLGFDAWGKRRFASGNANGQTDPNLPPNNLIGITTDRGYTGHEHLDELGLIHMNGRIYDPTIARFMSGDPNLTFSEELQGYNRYAYVTNNPLTYTDPDGYDRWGDGGWGGGPGGGNTNPDGSAAGSKDTRGWGSEPREHGDKSTRAYDTQPSVERHIEAYAREIYKNAMLLTSKTPLQAGMTPAEWEYRVASYMQLLGYDIQYNPNKPRRLTNELVNMVDKLTGRYQMIDGEYTLLSVTNIGAIFIARSGLFLSKVAQEELAAANAAGKKFPCRCFVAGTLVQTPGGLREIQDIALGDQVLSRNDETGEVAYKAISHIYRRYGRPILNLELQDQASNQLEKLGVTDEHPFFVVGKGWTPAEQLAVGDRLHSERQGSLVVVKAITKDAFKQSTFNFTVDGYHTYFVGKFSTWVHNNDCVTNVDEKRKNATGKSDAHGDPNALSKAEKQIEALREKLNEPGLGRRDRIKIEQKIKNIRETAESRRKGETHWTKG